MTVWWRAKAVVQAEEKVVKKNSKKNQSGLLKEIRTSSFLQRNLMTQECGVEVKGLAERSK